MSDCEGSAMRADAGQPFVRERVTQGTWWQLTEAGHPLCLTDYAYLVEESDDPLAEPIWRCRECRKMVYGGAVDEARWAAGFHVTQDMLRNNEPGNASLGERLTVERGARYGHPVDNYRRIGVIWGALLDREPVPPAVVGLMLLGVKLGRLAHSPFDEDGLDDVLGYVAAQRLLGEALG